MNAAIDAHPARLTIDYPDRELDRMSTLLRPLFVLPIAVVVGLIGGTASGGAFAGGLLVLSEGVLRWGLRVQAYALLLVTDRYPPFLLA